MLSTNQQSMLDLALACDLKVSAPAKHAGIRLRHQAIMTQAAAASYINSVENKIHGRRKFHPPTRNLVAIVPQVHPPKPVWKLSSMAASCIIVFLTVVTAVLGWEAHPGANLVFVMLGLMAMLVVLGCATTNHPLGVLINERNLMSLSRFQMMVWTVIILSGYFTFALMRIKWMLAGVPAADPITAPLDIQVDWHLWSLMGISTTSLVGSSLILSTKKDQTAAPAATQKAALMNNEPEQDIINNKQGILYANKQPSDARLTDMFEGDEIANTARIDLAKVQMFYFTVIAAICIAVMVFKMVITGNSYLDHLPLLSDGLVAILGISHAGYLTSKAVSRTQSTP
jgi:hypothetical protein